MKSRQDFATEKEWLDYFKHYSADMALQGLLSSYAGASVDPKPDIAATKSTGYADALIAALNKTDNNG